MNHPNNRKERLVAKRHQFEHEQETPKDRAIRKRLIREALKAKEAQNELEEYTRNPDL